MAKVKRSEIVDAQGQPTGEVLLHFICPGCGDSHTPNVGEGSPCWTWNGDLDRPTLAPSLLVRSGHYAPGHTGPDCWCTYNQSASKPAPFHCYLCHSFVRDGRIEFLSDCTHKLAGQTVELPELESA